MGGQTLFYCRYHNVNTYYDCDMWTSMYKCSLQLHSHSANRHLLNTYYIPETVLVAEHTKLKIYGHCSQENQSHYFTVIVMLEFKNMGFLQNSPLNEYALLFLSISDIVGY